MLLDELALTTAEGFHGELHGDRFIVEQIHRQDGGEAPLLLGEVRRARGAGALKIERHLAVDDPALLGRLTVQLSFDELVDGQRLARETRTAPPEVELVMLAQARRPG